jgi:hypothetical protein
MRVDVTRGEEMVPQPTGDRGNRPPRLSQHLHEVETHPNRSICTAWCKPKLNPIFITALQAFIHILVKQKNMLFGTIYRRAGKSILSPKYHAELCKWTAQLGFGSCGWVLMFWADYDISVWHATENPDSSILQTPRELSSRYFVWCWLA